LLMPSPFLLTGLQNSWGLVKDMEKLSEY